MLVVRSVLRERGNEAFRALSAGFHVVIAVLAALLLPLPYALLAAGLTTRAVALPLVQRRLAGRASPLRPVHVGVVELVTSLAVVATAFVSRSDGPRSRTGPPGIRRRRGAAIARGRASPPPLPPG